MKFKLDTSYKNQDRHDNSIACLTCVLETANVDLRNRVNNAIQAAMSGLEQEQPKAPMGMRAED
jgi:hypothetical protein